MALEVLRKIEEEAGRPVNELFDMICGVSTGAILAVMLGEWDSLYSAEAPPVPYLLEWYKSLFYGILPDS